jgi:peptide chain release factor subunit 1
MLHLQKRSAPSELSPVSALNLKALADARSEKGDFLSVYFATNNKDDIRFVASRLKLISKVLPEDLRGSFSKTLSLAEKCLSEPRLKGERGRVVFASGAESFLNIYRLSLEFDPLVVWDNSPFLLPLARLRDDYEDYALLLIDSREAKLFLVRSDMMEEKDNISIDLINKHKKGGWSQMRFSRLRKEAIKSFINQVAEDLRALEDQKIRGLVVAGPGEAKYQLVEVIPTNLRNKLLGIIDISMDISPRNLMKLGDQVAQESDNVQGKKKVLMLKDAILKGLPASYGLMEVKHALEEGRVNYLLIRKDFHLPGMICKKCRIIHETHENCPTCGEEMAALRLEELLEIAQNTGTYVEFVEKDEFLESIGGLGAILRY